MLGMTISIFPVLPKIPLLLNWKVILFSRDIVFLLFFLRLMPEPFTWSTILTTQHETCKLARTDSKLQLLASESVLLIQFGLYFSASFQKKKIPKTKYCFSLAELCFKTLEKEQRPVELLGCEGYSNWIKPAQDLPLEWKYAHSFVFIC